MTVLQVSTADVAGGAESVARELHHAYLARGVDSWMAVGSKHLDDPRVIEIPNASSRSAWTRSLGNVAERITETTMMGRAASRALMLAADANRYSRIWRGLEDFGFPGTERILELTPQAPTILHIHNLHGYYFDLRRLPRISSMQPTILTLHDAWLLTGHCAHPFNCPRWRTGCGDCPDLGTYPPISKDATAKNVALKRTLLERSRVGIATPSRWLMNMLLEAGFDDPAYGVRLIPNGVDTTIFRPADKRAARASLGLPQDRDIMLFAGQTVTQNCFKDFGTLMDALPALASRGPMAPLLVTLGEDRSESRVLDGVEVVSVPFTTDAAQVASYYSAADLYVHPARAENLPLTVLEAMACGTPIVASDVGGIPEIVLEGETGLLVPEGDAQAFAAAVASLLDDQSLRTTMSAAGPARIARCFSFDSQVDAYLNWYAELAEQATRGRD